MIRFLISLVVYSTIARWGYAELTMMFPSAAPYMKEVVQRVQIPTHHHWPTRDEVFDYVNDASESVEEALDAVEDLKTALRERRPLAEYQG